MAVPHGLHCAVDTAHPASILTHYGALLSSAFLFDI
jgi:hypothetical protein